MPRAEEIDQKVEENPLTSDSQESAVFSTSLLPKTQTLEQNIRTSAGTGGDSRQQFGNYFSLLLPKTEVLDHSVSPSSTSQPRGTEVLDQNVTRHPAEDTCGVKEPAAVLIYPFLLPKAEVLDQNFQDQAVPGPLGSPEQDSSAPMNPPRHQTVYLVSGGSQQKSKGQRRRVCTRADCPFCNIQPCGACRPCTNPDSRSRCILR